MFVVNFFSDPSQKNAYIFFLPRKFASTQMNGICAGLRRNKSQIDKRTVNGNIVSLREGRG